MVGQQSSEEQLILQRHAPSRSTCRPAPTIRQAGGEALVAAEAWWRAGALAALAAFTIGPAAAAPRAEGAALHRAAAGLLAGTLDAISSAPSLQDPARTGARAGPGAVYAAAAAMLQVRARAALPCRWLPGAEPGLVTSLEGSC